MKKYRIVLGITTILWTFVIFGFSFQNGTDSSEVSGSLLDWVISLGIPMSEYLLRKTAHVGIYLVLGMSSTAWGISIFIERVKKPWFYGGLSGFIYSLSCACIDELHQSFTVGRDGKIADVGIDAIGFVIGTIFIVIMMQYLIKKRTTPESRK